MKIYNGIMNIYTDKSFIYHDYVDYNMLIAIRKDTHKVFRVIVVKDRTPKKIDDLRKKIAEEYADALGVEECNLLKIKD